MIKQNEPIKIKRSQISMAGYNPRKITSEAKKKLRDNLQSMGLMGGIVWNERTGNLVSGHQRITILDQENGYKKNDPNTDYEVYVTRVDLDDKQEKSQNIFFNNQSAMGFFDEDKLKDIMKEVDFSEMTGFSKQNQVSLFGESSLTDEEYEEIATKVHEQTDKIKEMRKNVQSEGNANYIVLVFKNRSDKEQLVTNLGVNLDDGRFCNGETFLEEMYNSFQEGQD